MLHSFVERLQRSGFGVGNTNKVKLTPDSYRVDSGKLTALDLLDFEILSSSMMMILFLIVPF